MNWRHILFLSCFTAFLLLIVVDGRRNIVKATTGGSSKENLKKRLFVQKLDASKFLKKQGKRSARSSEERDDLGTIIKLALANMYNFQSHYGRREYERDNITEEDHEEHDDRTRERDEYEYYDYD